jgi:hypothetical protein
MRARLTLSCAAALTAAIAFAAEQPAVYREPFAESFPIRREQHLQIKAYAERLLQEQARQALAAVQPDFSSPEAYTRSVERYRQQLREHFGTPPPHAQPGKVTRFQQIGEDADATIHRVWIEVLPGVEAYGLYMRPKKSGAASATGKLPLLIAQHGGGGNPEAISDLDTRINYRSFGREALRRGYAVWAPALAMRCGFCEDPAIPGASRELLDQKLKLAGTSIIGLELHKIIESTQTLLRIRPELDAERVGMTGLSWGGFFTMYATALAPFIKVAAPSGYLRDQAAQLERAGADDAKPGERDIIGALGHAQAIALICPRPCLLQLGEQDGTINPIPGARIEADRAGSYYQRLGLVDRFQFQLHAGGHEYDTPAILAFFDRHLR